MTAILAKPLILVTGATGYVGGRLLKALQAAGYPVRCLARRPEFLAPRVSSDTEIVKGDCLDAASLPPACAGVHTAYYLARTRRRRRIPRLCMRSTSRAGHISG